jgi:GNAT superfamily N-acetyltransferase
MALRFKVEQPVDFAFAVKVYDGKKAIGRVGVLRNSELGVGMVKSASVDTNRHRQGIGTKLYERAARESCKRFGLPLASDVDRTYMAQGFWDKQERKGRARKEVLGPTDYFVLSCPAPKSLKGAQRR